MTDRSKEPLSRHELRQLLLAVRRGEEGAFSCLYGKYLPLVLRLSADFVPHYASDADAEDFRQEAMLALYRAALAYDLDQGEVEFGLFAKICITNRLVDRLRALERYWKNEGNRETDSAEPAVTPDTAESGDPAAYLMDDEAVRALNAIIDRHLSVYEQRVFRMYLAGYAAGEIASATGREEKSVSNAIYRIRRKLKALLNTL
ncbi:MAG: sigma-70 family RNA polymerase sigma factor [Ruminococcaceae bacterium]|nr:sigma-70 family RNA polymerase sigma factor [Oscillospiraceae bacterium]